MSGASPRPGDRSGFPTLRGVYLNHAAVSPPSAAVQAAVAAALARYAAEGVGAVLPHVAQRERLRALLAGLVGAAPADLGLLPNTSHAVLAIAHGLAWRPGDRVLCFDGEFPTNVTPWQRAAEAYDLRLEFEALDGFGDGSGDGLARVEARLRRGLRLVAVSAVQFQTGLRMPLPELAALCHAHGAELFVDGIQAVGVVPLQLRAWGVDYLAAGSHKWLMGTEGAALLYVHPDRAAALVPRLAAWLSHEEPLRFLFEGEGHLRYDRPLRRRADVFELGAPNTLGFVALEAGAAPLAALGVERIHAHVQALLDPLEQGLRARGFHSARSPLPASRSGILSVRPPRGVDPVALHARLAAQGVGCSLPDGWLRFSPHWPNGADQLDAVLEAVDAALAGRPA